MKINGTMFSIVIALLCVINISPAQWTQTAGPEGGIVSVFSVNQSNNHVFAGVKGGVYRSTDEGITWSGVNTGLPANIQVTVLHSSGSDAYAFDGSTDVLYYSSDEGANWTLTTGTGLPLLPGIGQMVTLGGKLYGAVAGFTDKGVYCSTDHGASWTKTSNGLPSDFTPTKLFLSGSNLFVGAYLLSTTQGIYLSTDNGGNWTAAKTGFAATGGVTGFSQIGSTIFASTLNSGIFKTVNNGGNWSSISPTTPVVSLGAFAMTTTATNLFIGTGTVMKADNAGAGWDTVTTGLPPRNAGTAIKDIVVCGSSILASVANLGVWRSTDGGAHWNPSNTGLKVGEINGLFVDGASLYAGATTTGFFRTNDNGDTWTAINNGVDLRNNGYFNFITAGSYLLGGGGLNGMFRSTDGGNTWVPGTLNSPAYGFIKDGNDIYTGIVGNIAKSTDDGDTWTTINPGIPSYIVVLSVWKDGSVIMAGCSAAFKRSTDNGATWTAPASGLPGAVGYGNFVQVDSTIFVVNSYGVYRSTDQGASWTSSGSGLSGIYPNCIYIHNEDMFVGTTTGVYRSSDKGASWTGINTGFPQKLNVKILMSNGQYLFAGANPGSVWRRPINEVTGVQEISNVVPKTFSLEQNYPNPFNPTTSIKFMVLKSGFISLKIYDALGREVATLVNENLHPGTYRTEWNASEHPSGVYYYRLQAGEFSETKKLLLVR